MLEKCTAFRQSKGLPADPPPDSKDMPTPSPSHALPSNTIHATPATLHSPHVHALPDANGHSVHPVATNPMVSECMLVNER
jgi:hypothetical protein